MQLGIQRGTVITETASSCGLSAGTGVYALAAAANGLLAEDVRQISVDARIFYPRLDARAGIQLAYGIQKNLQKESERQGFLVKGIHLAECPLLDLAEVTVTAAGTREEPEIKKEKAPARQAEERADARAKAIDGRIARCDILMAGWAGMEGMLRIVEEKEARLKERFSLSFLEQIKGYRRYLFAKPGLDWGKEAVLVRQIREGGVLAALYRLTEEMGSGLEIDLKKIPILQETIEVCECFRLNPYQLASAGSFLALSGQGGALSRELRGQGMYAAVIGRMTGKAAKILKYGEAIRYMNRPAADEIYRIF